jgi:hypothetical protein
MKSFKSLSPAERGNYCLALRGKHVRVLYIHPPMVGVVESIESPSYPEYWLLNIKTDRPEDSFGNVADPWAAIPDDDDDQRTHPVPPATTPRQCFVL